MGHESDEGRRALSSFRGEEKRLNDTNVLLHCCIELQFDPNERWIQVDRIVLPFWISPW